jgi:sugar (pentulose or hexulose) kinase
LQSLRQRVDLQQVQRIAIDGTSGSVLLTTRDGQALTPCLMYNDASSNAGLETLRTHCPENQHLCLNLSSGLVKAMQLSHGLDSDDYLVVNQGDFISNHLLGNWGHSDYHNALKLGYDAQRLQWPDWVASILGADKLPAVYPPGTPLGRIEPAIADTFGLSRQTEICAGSTDANAAFIAAGVDRPGQAVTSLGSTLVLKMLSENPVASLQSGVYSHRLGDYWLAGGASNAGAAILRDFFDDAEIEALSRDIDPLQSSALDYYPLRQLGERFPLYDPNKAPCLTPRPASDSLFLHAMLEGLTRIERDGYQTLQRLGAPALQAVTTVGGGAKNPQWQAMRERLLGVPVTRATHSEASYGMALMALRGLEDFMRA